jgi:ketosteroid isomerase-like protein
MSATVVEALEAANAEFYAAFESCDIDRMAAVWDDSDDISCVHPGSAVLRGRSAVLRSWSVIMANTSYIQFFLTDVDVTVRGDVAVVTCAENILTAIEEDDGGGEALAHPGRVIATNVFRRNDNRWRMWVHHGSPVFMAEAGE